MNDNLLLATNRFRKSVIGLKQKVGQIQNHLAQLESEIEKISLNVDDFSNQADIYRQRVERESRKEIRALMKQISELQSSRPTKKEEPIVSRDTIRVATTIGVFEAILRLICGLKADDFHLMSCSFLFPAVYERVVKVDDDDYLLDEVPESARVVVERGRGYLEWLREECQTYLTNPEAWETYSPYICEWWRNDALPLLYGSRDDQWETDEPLSLVEMLSWKQNPEDRPILFPSVWDAREIYTSNKDLVYQSSGIQSFELKLFTNGGK